jgi:hypothetical protein
MADPRIDLKKILTIELEDLLEDIGLVEIRMAERLGREEITGYVFKSNDAFFRMEAESIRHLLKLIDAIDITLYKNADDMAAHLHITAKELLRAHEDPQAVYALFARKLQKVLKYVNSGDND